MKIRLSINLTKARSTYLFSDTKVRSSVSVSYLTTYATRSRSHRCVGRDHESVETGSRDSPCPHSEEGRPLTQYPSTRCRLCVQVIKAYRMSSQLTIGQLGKKAGVNVQTIRYYERLGLLNPTARRLSGYRLYGAEEIRRLCFIKNAQALGFTLREVTELLNLRVRSSARCDAVQRKAQEKLAQVERKAQDLRAMARSLRSLIRACESGRPTDACPIVEGLETQRRNADGHRQATR